MAESDGQGGDNGSEAGKDGPRQTDRAGGAQPQRDQAGGAGDAPALAIIEAFGGIRPMAKQLGLAVSTVQGWKERSAIPANRHDQIRAAAKQNDIAIDPETLRAAAPADAAPAQPQTIEGKAAAVAGGKSSVGREKTGEKTAESGGMSAASAAAGRRRQGEAPRREAAPRRGIGGALPAMLLGAVLVVAAAAATMYTQPYWSPLLAPAGQGQGDDGLAARLATLEERLATLQDSLPQGGSEATTGLGERVATLEAAMSQGVGQDPEVRNALESLSAELARLTDRIEVVEQEAADARSLADAPSPEIANRLSDEAARLDQLMSSQSELAARLDQAEAALGRTEAAREAAPGSRETLLLLAVLQLRDALQGSGPYEQPLRMLENLAEEDEALAASLAPLQRRASAGLPTRRDLQAAFPDVARRLAAIEMGQEGEGWSAGVLRRLSETINLRPVGFVEGDSPTAVAARAEVKLNEGDLAGALDELDSLEGAAAEATAKWRADAAARLAAERAISELGSLVSQRFADMVDG